LTEVNSCASIASLKFPSQAMTFQEKIDTIGKVHMEVVVSDLTSVLKFCKLKILNKILRFKGTVAQDFLPLGFSMN
jgi:hypothetical protein